jgi:hypothetical protein
MKILVESIETGSAHITGLEREKLRRTADPAAREGSVPRSFPVAVTEDAVVGRVLAPLPRPIDQEMSTRTFGFPNEAQQVRRTAPAIRAPRTLGGSIGPWADRTLGEARTDQAELKLLYTPRRSTLYITEYRTSAIDNLRWFRKTGLNWGFEKASGKLVFCGF